MFGFSYLLIVTIIMYDLHAFLGFKSIWISFLDGKQVQQSLVAQNPLNDAPQKDAQKSNSYTFRIC